VVPKFGRFPDCGEALEEMNLKFPKPTFDLKKIKIK